MLVHPVNDKRRLKPLPLAVVPAKQGITAILPRVSDVYLYPDPRI